MMLATITECEWMALDSFFAEFRTGFCVLKVQHVDYAVPATERLKLRREASDSLDLFCASRFGTARFTNLELTTAASADHVKLITQPIYRKHRSNTLVRKASPIYPAESAGRRLLVLGTAHGE